jgi:hypothetical protein
VTVRAARTTQGGTPRALRKLALAAGLAAISVPFLAPEAASAGSLKLGLQDNRLYEARKEAIRAEWLDRTKAAGADYVSLGAFWRAIAPSTRPPGFDPSDPADPAYDWGKLDAAVRDASARGLIVVLVAVDAPAWAEGANPPAGVPPGTWRPDPSAYGAFSHALAVRYSGTFPDPLNPGAALPRVRFFKAWNEPNLNRYLNPQGSGNKPESADIYRRLLNALYEGVTEVSGDNQVIAGGPLSFADPKAGGDTHPLDFLRRLFCLKEKKGKLRATACPDKAHFDILAYNAIQGGNRSPRTRFPHPDDAGIAELDSIQRLLRKAKQKRRALPKKRKPLWISEFWWRSQPPASAAEGGVPLDQHARFLEEALYLFWKQRVRVAFWFLIRDPDPTRSSVFTVDSGLYFFDETKKPALQAFRFPFVTDKKKRGKKARVWGISPVPGTVTIQTLQGSDFQTIKQVKAGGGGVFETRAKIPKGTDVRALAQSGEASLVWHHR